MKLIALFLVLMVSGGAALEDNCSYHDVLNYIQLTKNKDLLTLARPVKNHSEPTVVKLDILLYAILDVREIDQTFVSYLWILIKWNNDYTQWNTDDFCGINSVNVPIEHLWKPDLTIEEMTEKDKSSTSPYLTLNSSGEVFYQNDQVVVSTCRIDVYKFPFDTQSCNLSFKSVLYPDKQIRLIVVGNSEENTFWSQEVMRTQYEWLFVNMAVDSKHFTAFYEQQDIITYTINMKRRSVLYVVNFLLPVLFFLCLDFASFLISDIGGEKLGFQITVLLAVTVMQLILNEILPASSNRVPLIAVYCIGIFFLMLLSLLETIVVLYLINKDQQPDQDHTDLYRRIKDRVFLFKDSPNAVHSECSVHTKKKAIKRRLTEDTQLSNELLSTLMNELLQRKKEEEQPGYWTKKTKIINRFFFIFYVTSVIVFLITMFFLWTDPNWK